jgi:hypothetical protein
VPEAAAVADSLGVELIGGSGDFGDLRAAEKPTDDRITFAPEMLGIALVEDPVGRPQRTPLTHGDYPTPSGTIHQLSDISKIYG